MLIFLICFELGLKVSYGVPVGTFAWAYFGVGGGLALRNDSFSAGLIAGLAAELSVGDAGRLAAATGACCVTGLGVTGIRPIRETMKLAGLE